MPLRVAVIGGGASGLAAAVSCKLNRPSACVTVFEKQPRVGKKLLATGNGRCNLTSALPEADFPAHYSDPRAARAVFAACGRDKTLAFFQELGLLTAVEGGGVYPATFQASTVLDVLREATESLGVSERCGEGVEEIAVTAQGFAVRGEAFDRVICATGGAAAVRGGAGVYALLTKLGHTVVPPVPALVPLKCTSPLLRGASGLRARAAVALSAGKTVLAEEKGEVLFRDYGLSGVPIFQLSRVLAEETAHGRSGPFRLTLDLLPEGAEEALAAHAARCGALPADCFFSGVLNKKLGGNLLRQLGEVQTVADVNIRRAASAARSAVFTEVTPLPFDMAQAAAGGVPLSEVELPSMRSLRVPGLYLTGEALDITGACGGFNLQWAWSTGLLAGGNAVC